MVDCQTQQLPTAQASQGTQAQPLGGAVVKYRTCASRAGPSCQADSARPADRGGQDGTGQGILQRRAALLLQRPLLLQQPAVHRWTGGAGALRWTRGESSLPGSSKPCRGSTLSPPLHTAWAPPSPVQLPLPRLEGGRLCRLPRPPLLGQLGQAQLEGGGAQLVTVRLVTLRQVWVVGQRCCEEASSM